MRILPGTLLFLGVIKEAYLSIPFFMSIDLFSPHANLNLELRADCVVDLILVCAAKYFGGVSCVQPSGGKHGEEAAPAQTRHSQIPGAGTRVVPARTSVLSIPSGTRCVISTKRYFLAENYDCFVKMKIMDGHLKPLKLKESIAFRNISHNKAV